MINGIFSITFRGATDWGQGLLLFKSGEIVGVDAGGISYDGTYSETEGEISLKVAMTVPPGAQLVQGTPPQAKAYIIDFSVTLIKQQMLNSVPILVELPPGPVNVIFKMLRPL